MSLRASLKNLIRRDDERPSLRERAADLQVDLSRVARQPIASADPTAEPAPDFADQVAQAGPDHDVLAGGGIDHRDGTVSYADASGKVSRRPMAHWIGFNALQMHNRVQHEMGRRRIIEANPLPAEEYAAWEAKIRREMRSDAVFALAFHPDRAFKAVQDLRSGAEPLSNEVRAAGDADLVALAPKWQAASDAYDQAIQEQIAVSDAAQPGPWYDQSHAELARQVAERTGVEAAEEASGEACRALGAIEDQIAELPAASLAGLRLKARVAQRCDDIGIEWPDGLGDGLARDLLAFGADGLANENPVGDALLLQLGRQFEAARKREIVACEACNEAQREADRHMPGHPAALLFRASDHPLRLGKFLTHPDDLEGTEVTAADVAWMKRKPYVRQVERPVRPEDNLPADAHTVVEAHPWPEAQDRADEIVTAWAAWHAERQRVQDEYVTTALDDAADAAAEATAALAQRIADLPAHTAAGFRTKLQALESYNPRALLSEADVPDEPDPDHLLSHSLWRDLQGGREDADPPAQQPEAAPRIGTNLVDQIDFASSTLEDLRALYDLAGTVGDVAYGMAWTGAAHAHKWSRQSHPGEHHNAAGKLIQWLGEALADVADATRKEVQRRQPETPGDRETRLTILSRPVIQNGDRDETEAFARDLVAHVETERAGR